MGLSSYGKKKYEYWETGEYNVHGLHFQIYQGGLPEYYMGKKYLVVYGYGNHGRRQRDLTDDWKQLLRQIISTESKVGNLGKYE